MDRADDETGAVSSNAVPDPPARVWGVLEVRPAAGIAVALSGVAVAMVVAVFGGLPGSVLGGAVFVLATLLSVWQPTRLTFTDTGVRQDRWLFGVRRHTTIGWDRAEALCLDYGADDESPSWWWLRLRTPVESPRLMLAGDVEQRARGGPLRRRHFRKHAGLIAAFHRRGVPFLDPREGDEPRPADEVTYARYLWHHYDTDDTRR
jgi:hypothetical protein